MIMYNTEIASDACISTCGCPHVHICTLSTHVRRESGLFVSKYIYMYSDTFACMSLHARYALLLMYCILHDHVQLCV